MGVIDYKEGMVLIDKSNGLKIRLLKPFEEHSVVPKYTIAVLDRGDTHGYWDSMFITTLKIRFTPIKSTLIKQKLSKVLKATKQG